MILFFKKPVRCINAAACLDDVYGKSTTPLRQRKGKKTFKQKGKKEGRASLDEQRPHPLDNSPPFYLGKNHIVEKNNEMGSFTSKETAFLVDGLVHFAGFLIALFIGTAIGLIGLGQNSTYTIDYAIGKRKRHRAIFYTLAMGAAAFGFAMVFMVEGTGTFDRGDTTTEWAGWVGRLLLAVAITWAFTESVFMTLQNALTLEAVVIFSYLGLVFVNFLTTNTQYAIALIAWGFFWLLGALLSVIWSNLSESKIGLSYWAIVWIYVFSGIQALWLILADNVSDVPGFNNEVEAWVLCGVDILYTSGALILLGLGYFGNKPGPDSPVYYEYTAEYAQSKKTDVEASNITLQSQIPLVTPAAGAPLYTAIQRK